MRVILTQTCPSSYQDVPVVLTEAFSWQLARHSETDITHLAGVAALC